ncbi:hypothetical protein HMPREF9996_00309 [Aggregatibacter actinomycetemcomitans Y4]|nr:hypothetical protein HMPREF9996_00309 [Aggregatibacter actinomycetemcomitans Y4]
MHQNIQAEIAVMSAVHQRTTNFNIGEMGANQNLPAPFGTNVTIHVITIVQNQIGITDFFLPHGKAISDGFAEG